MPDNYENFDGPISPEAERLARDELSRRQKDTEVTIFDSMSSEGGPQIEPVRLDIDDTLKFFCHRGISCWNRCCYGADVTLTPFDILGLCKHLDMRPAWLLQKYTVPAMWENAGLPVAKLKMTGNDGKGACAFLNKEKGCTVYEDRPAICRYYPLGLAAIKMKDAEHKDQFHFLVKEDHCKGHKEVKTQTVADFLGEQEVLKCNQHNQGWVEIMMKMVSWKTMGGPQGKELSDQTKKMFFMVSTDADMFRRFVFESKFLDTYEITAEAIEKLKTNDEALLLLGFDWMKNVMFNEPTITMKQDVLREGIAKSRSEMGAS